MSWNRSEEGKREQGTGKRDRGSGSGRLKGLVAGVIVVVGAGIATWILWPEGETRRDAASTKRGLIKEVKPAAAPKAAAEKPAGKSHLTETNLPAAYLNAKGLDPNLFPYDDGRKVLSTRTNSWDQIIDICIMPSGKSRKVVRNAKPPVFEHGTDQLIAMALSGHDDEEATPIPISEGMEPEFLESLKTPIVIRDDDSESVRRSKERVLEARQVIQEELRKGRSFKSILEEHVALRKDNAEMRATAMRAVSELKKEGDASLVNEYVKKANVLLRQNGIREISGGGRKPREQ